MQSNKTVGQKTTAPGICRAGIHFRRNRPDLWLAGPRAPVWIPEFEKSMGTGPNRRVKGYRYQRNGFCHVLTFRPLRLTL